jgi:hypothetical protein
VRQLLEVMLPWERWSPAACGVHLFDQAAAGWRAYSRKSARGASG